MKKIRSIHDALAHILSGLYYSEMLIRDQYREYRSRLLSHALVTQLEQHACFCETNLLKLERIFNYLMVEPLAQKNAAIHQLTTDTRELMASVQNRSLRDILTIGYLQNIQAVKLSSYRSAYLLAAELELDTAVDLIQQILEQETSVTQLLSNLSIAEFNQYRKTADV